MSTPTKSKPHYGFRIFSILILVVLLVLFGSALANPGGWAFLGWAAGFAGVWWFGYIVCWLDEDD